MKRPRAAPWFGFAAVLGTGCGLDARVLDRDIDASAPFDAGLADMGTPFEAGSQAATALAAGEYHGCRLQDPVLGCWGSNTSGQALPGGSDPILVPTSIPSTPRFTSLALGEHHSCALSADAAVFCWGDNSRGQLGRRTAGPEPAASGVPGRVIALTSGHAHACAILQDRSLWCWGDSAESQLGLGVYDTYLSDPAQVGTERDWQSVSAAQGHTCGIRANGVLLCWGRNTAAQLGIGDTSIVNSGTPTRVSGPDGWLGISLGQDGSCGIRSPGTLWCWGDNHSGQLGETAGTLASPVQLGSDTDWQVVDTGTFHSCGLRSGGRLYCWGRNIEGQLGLGRTSEQEPITAIEPAQRFSQIAVGRFHTSVLGSDGRILCAGRNEAAECGLGNTQYAVPSLTEQSQ